MLQLFSSPASSLSVASLGLAQVLTSIIACADIHRSAIAPRSKRTLTLRQPEAAASAAPLSAFLAPPPFGRCL